MSDIDARLATLFAARQAMRDPMEFLLDVAELIAKDAAESLGRQVDEIGILLVGTHSPYLRFVAPRKLCDLGTIPTSKRDSIAVSVFHRKAGEANNNVPLVRHVAFFESVRVVENVQPIMKMITVPIVSGAQVVGVAQVSKKGQSPAEAGPDFTAADLRKVAEYFESRADTLRVARPERF